MYILKPEQIKVWILYYIILFIVFYNDRFASIIVIKLLSKLFIIYTHILWEAIIGLWIIQEREDLFGRLE